MAFFLKYVCQSATCSDTGGRGFIWYKKLGGVRSPSLAPKIVCHRCHNEVTCSDVRETQPKGGVDHDASLASRHDPSRNRRTQNMRSTEMLANLKAQDEEHKRLFGEDTDEKMDESIDEKDVEWLLPPAFNPKMRLTKGGSRRTCRVVWPQDATLRKSQPGCRVGDAHHRKEGNASPIMGLAINGKGLLSAWEHAGRPNYALDKTKSSEWCHLWADCLGGPTIAANLVSASYCANTEMLVIEHKLKGKAQYSITVVADCATAHVAEMIHYTITHRKSSASRTWMIDGRNDAFTREDMTALERDLKTWMTKHP
jgi:hypothetical protein